MLRSYVTKKHLTLYFLAIVITWLEAIITPALIQYIVASFTNRQLHLLWQILLWGIGGNLVLVLGLAGKRYYYARLMTDFKVGIKRAIFRTFLYSRQIPDEEVLSDLENDVQQLENSYIEPTVIIVSSLGFTVVSIAYALWTNFYLGLLFIIFYSVPVLCSGLGSKRLDRIAEQKSLANQNYIARVNNMIAGVAPIRHYQGQNLFFKRFSKDLEQALQEEVSYEKQRSLNSLFINSIDAFCSVAPIVIGGFMTYQNYLSAASFVGIYLVSHNIGYQFQELSYFINTRKSAKSLCDKYQDLFGNKLATDSIFDQSVFPIQLEQVSVEKDGETILAPCDLTIHAGEKIAIIGESGAGKTTLLNILYGEIHPSQGQIRYQGRELTSCQLYQAGAYILQSSHVFDDLSVEENIALGQEIDQQRMDNILQETGLLSLKGKVPSNQTLSGGEKQRLEIARALYHKRQFILADEVKANLDAKNQEKINQLLFSLPQAVVEVIHHYTKEDLKRYDKVIHLKK